MSFDFPAQPQRRVQPRGGGCGRLIFMMMIMFAAYYMFSGGRARQQKPQRGAGGPGDILAPAPHQNDRDDLKQEIFGDGTVGLTVDRQPAGREMPSTGQSGAQRGWQMEEVEPATKSDNDFRNDSRLPDLSNPDRSSSQSRSSSDWSISDADDLKAEAVPAGRQQAPLKKADNGWKLEEVD